MDEHTTTTTDWMPLAWRLDLALALASALCFGAAWLDGLTGALRGAALLFGLLGTMIVVFSLVGYGAWKLSGVIVATVAQAAPTAPRRVAVAAETDALPAGYAWRSEPAAGDWHSARINKIREAARATATAN